MSKQMSTCSDFFIVHYPRMLGFLNRTWSISLVLTLGTLQKHKPEINTFELALDTTSPAQCARLPQKLYVLHFNRFKDVSNRQARIMVIVASAANICNFPTTKPSCHLKV